LIINVKISFAEFLIFGYTLRERKEKPLPVGFCRAVKLCRGCKTECKIIQCFFRRAGRQSRCNGRTGRKPQDGAAVRGRNETELYFYCVMAKENRKFIL